MKYLNLFILFLLCQNAFSQTKLNIRVLSRATEQPIEGVSIYYPNNDEGTLTNANGKAALNVLDAEPIVVTHIGYDTLYLTKAEIVHKDTILVKLNARVIQISEIAIPPYNLIKSLNYVLKNFNKLYVNTAYEKVGNFKETARVNGILKRLVLTKLGWWSNGYILNKKKQPKLRLFDVEYNRELPFNIFVDIPEYNEQRTGHVEIKSIIPIMYLKTYLQQFIEYTPSLRSTNISSDDNIIKVEYESDWSTVKNQTTRSVGHFIFDKKTKAIIEFLNIIEDKSSKKELEIESTKTIFTRQNKKSRTKHSFFKNLDGKYSLKSLSLFNETELIYQGKTFNLSIDNSFFLLKETAKRKADKGNSIDLNIPLHKNIPEKAGTVSSKNSILLNEDEEKFIENGK